MIFNGLLGWADPNEGVASYPVNINNNEKQDEVKIWGDGKTSKAVLIVDGITEDNARLSKGTYRFRSHSFSYLGIEAPFEEGDLVQVPFTATSNSPAQTRVRDVYLDFEPRTGQMRKMVEVAPGKNFPADFFQSDALKLVSKVSELEAKADSIIAKVKRTHQKDWRRREELLGYAPLPLLNEPYRIEIVRIEGRLIKAFEDEIERQKIDIPGRSHLLGKIREMTSIHYPAFF